MKNLNLYALANEFPLHPITTLMATGSAPRQCLRGASRQAGRPHVRDALAPRPHLRGRRRGTGEGDEARRGEAPRRLRSHPPRDRPAAAGGEGKGYFAIHGSGPDSRGGSIPSFAKMKAVTMMINKRNMTPNTRYSQVGSGASVLLFVPSLSITPIISLILRG